MSSDTTARTYRFGPRDRTGWLLGLQGSQCIALGGAIFVAGVLLNEGMPAIVVVTPLAAAAAFAFASVGGQRLHELVPVACRWGLSRSRGKTRWFGQVPTFSGNGTRVVEQPDLPPPLSGLSVREAESAGWAKRGRPAGAAVIRDDRERTLSAVLRVQGRQFALCERGEQERLLQMWGDALSAFCAERGPVGRIRWTEWTAPAGLADQLAYLEECVGDNGDRSAVTAYRELLEQAGPMATRHEILLTVTIEERRLHASRGTKRAEVAEETLMEEMRLLLPRLEAAGLAVDAPLSPSEVAVAIRARLDPFGIRAGGGRGRSLAELAGFVSVANSGPLAMRAAWDHVQVDGACHAAYVIAEWPRLEVPSNWMEPVLLHAGGIRTVAVHYEPVAPSRSQRQIDRETVKLLSDEEQRNRAGFRTGARHRRAQKEVLDREAELVAGYGEFEFAGFVVVSAADTEQLERSCAEHEQVGAQAGLELRRLDGRHDVALACMLPIGRGLAPRRFT